MSRPLPQADRRRLTDEEYFDLDQQEGVRYDLWNGEPFAMDVMAMPGGSLRHSLIAMSVGKALLDRLGGRGCRVFNSDLRLRLSSDGDYCHPDVILVCDPAPYEQYIDNPLLIVEVLSAGTESDDRGLKFQRYRALPSLQAYLLLAQDRPHAELYQRAGEGLWHLTEASGVEAVLKITGLDLALPLAEIYRQVEF